MCFNILRRDSHLLLLRHSKGPRYNRRSLTVCEFGDELVLVVDVLDSLFGYALGHKLDSKDIDIRSIGGVYVQQRYIDNNGKQFVLVSDLTVRQWEVEKSVGVALMPRFVRIGVVRRRGSS